MMPKNGLKRLWPLFFLALLLLSGGVLASALPDPGSPSALHKKPGSARGSNGHMSQGTDHKNNPPAAASSGTAPPPGITSTAMLASTSSRQSVGPQAKPAMNSAHTVQINEQFSGSSLNSSLWQAMARPKAYRNNEEQDYLPSQVSVSSGMLHITAAKDASGNWHSGEVDSKWSYTYGEFETRLAISATGPGIWPAAWMLGATDPWPNGGELDMFEHINGDGSVYGTLHGGGSGVWQLQKQVNNIDVTQYHTYKLVKQPNDISWYIDGVKQAEWTPAQTPASGVWPFESHANMAILNLAVGGSWPGPSGIATPDTVTMYVDYFTVKNAS